MNVMIRQQTDREAERLQANREELVERIGRAMREDGTTQPFQGFHLYRRSSPLELLHGTCWTPSCGSRDSWIPQPKHRSSCR